MALECVQLFLHKMSKAWHNVLPYWVWCGLLHCCMSCVTLCLHDESVSYLGVVLKVAFAQAGLHPRAEMHPQAACQQLLRLRNQTASTSIERSPHPIVIHLPRECRLHRNTSDELNSRMCLQHCTDLPRLYGFHKPPAPLLVVSSPVNSAITLTLKA